MRKGVLDEDGQVRCPKCGSTSFRTKRSAKAKIGLGLAVGIGALAAPKRIKCLACGELFRARATAARTAGTADPVPATEPPRDPLDTLRELAHGFRVEPDDGDFALVLRQAVGRGAGRALRALRPDLDDEQIDGLVRATRWTEPVLLAGPADGLGAVAKALGAFAIRTRVTSPPTMTVDDGVTASLLLRKAFASSTLIDAVAALRPDLTRDQAEALVRAGTRKQPQAILVDRPRGEIEAAQRALRKIGAGPAIVVE